MDRLCALVGRVKRVMGSRPFQVVLAGVYLVNAVCFVVLLASDCLRWWPLGAEAERSAVAVSLAGTSYLLWLLFVFIGVGWLSWRLSAPVRRAPTPGGRPRLFLVRAVGFPLLYGTYFAWGVSSTQGPAPGLGHVSVGACLAFSVCYLLAQWADTRPRPPRGPRRGLTRGRDSRAASQTSLWLRVRAGCNSGPVRVS